jgi:hypothetical protein
MRLPRHLWRFLGVSVLAVAGFGCSVHPLPDDISRESTYNIVVKIRCEARDQVFREVQALLSRSHSPIIKSMDPTKVIENLAFIRKTDPRIAAIIDKYRLSAISYGFDFTVTENNTNHANADFILPFNTTTFSLGLTSKAELQRQGERKVDLVEVFQELGSLKCNDVSATGINIVYPVTGSIGMDEIIHSFFSVSESIPAQSTADDPVQPTDTVEGKFVDTLTFTTTLDSSLTPTVKLAPLKPKQFQLMDVTNSTFESKRVDKHVVVVTLSFPVEPAAPAKGAAGKTTPSVAPPSKSASAALPAIPSQYPSQLAPASAVSVASPALRKAATKASLSDNSKYQTIRDTTKEKAAEELCIQRALQREEQLNITRLDAPEVYCTFNYKRY